MALTFRKVTGKEVPGHFLSQGINTVFEIVDHEGISMLFEYPYEAARWARQVHVIGNLERPLWSRDDISHLYRAADL